MGVVASCFLVGRFSARRGSAGGKEENSMPASVTLGDARRVISAAEDEAQQIGQPMNIAVVDAGGNLVSHVRMDGAWIGSIDISINKAFTSRAFAISTKDLAAPSHPASSSMASTSQTRDASGSLRGASRLVVGRVARWSEP